MRKQELDNWVENGGELPDELTEDEKSYLEGLGMLVVKGTYPGGSYHYLTLNGKDHGKCIYWYLNGQKMIERYYLRDKDHGVFRKWGVDGTLLVHMEYVYGVFLRNFLKEDP